jgi:hypothetical protein
VSRRPAIPAETIRAAMERLLSGNAALTDGRLTVDNLAAEARTIRQTLYRTHKTLIDDFQARARRSESDGTTSAMALQTAQLRARLADAKRRAQDHHGSAQAHKAEAERLASKIAYLAAQNQALRGGRGGVTAIRNHAAHSTSDRPPRQVETRQ